MTLLSSKPKGSFNSEDDIDDDDSDDEDDLESDISDKSYDYARGLHSYVTGETSELLSDSE